jgi:hypothetical protein
MENLQFDLEGLYREIKERAFDEGALTREEWDDVVESVIEEHRGSGELDDNESLAEVIESMRARFEDFESEIGEM